MQKERIVLTHETKKTLMKLCKHLESLGQEILKDSSIYHKDRELSLSYFSLLDKPNIWGTYSMPNRPYKNLISIKDFIKKYPLIPTINQMEL